jgi:hypothetical protein
MADVELSALSVDYYAADVEVHRRTKGVIVRGEWTATDLPPFTIKANVQPLSGSDLKQVTEHERPEHMLRVTTREVLNIAGIYGAEFSDIIMHDGNQYKVVIRGNRHKGHFYKYFASLADGN